MAYGSFVTPMNTRHVSNRLIKNLARYIDEKCDPHHPESYATSFILPVDRSEIDQYITDERGSDQSVTEQSTKLK